MRQFLEIKSLKEARKIIQDTNKSLSIEQISIDDSLGRICGQSMFSPVDIPAFNRSTVDGYAVVAESVFGASASIPSLLNLIGSASMGKETSNAIKKGQCMYVPTGGMIPKGTTAMVMIEDTEKLDQETVMVYKPSKPGDYIVYSGDDVKKDSPVLFAGKKITPYDIGILAGMGITKVSVFTSLKFTVLSTGDEVIPIDKEPAMGEIRDINGHALKAWLKSQGVSVIKHTLVKDDFDQLKATIGTALTESDGIILSGGSSKGTRDYTRKVIESFDKGEILLHGLAIKPGKPTILGKIDKTLIFGLPGHPVSALMVCRQLIGFFIRTAYRRQSKEVSFSAELMHHVQGAPGRDSFQLVNLKKEGNKWLADPLHGSSGMISLLTKASGYIVIPRNIEGFLEGSHVKVKLLEEVSVEVWKK